MLMKPPIKQPIFYLLFVATLVWTSGLLADWQQYNARYALYRNGKLIGKAEFTFKQTGENWVIRSEGSGTHGLARLLGARDTEYTIGQLSDGRFIPEQYSQHTRVAGFDNKWTADFDWQQNKVLISKGKESVPLTMNPIALDGLSLKVELQRRLRDDDPNMMFFLVDEDEISQQQFRVLQPETIETSLGCLQTTPVERVREGSTRYTRAWHAPGLDFITVRMEHGKTGGDHLELRITGLELDQREIVPKPGCAASQTSAGSH
jgi:hypothetical protein